MRQLPLLSAATRGRLLLNMIIRKNVPVLVEREYLDNIKLSVCAVGLIAHMTRWENDGLKLDSILDNVYDMCHHDCSAAIGYLELIAEEYIENLFSEEELESIRALAKFGGNI